MNGKKRSCWENKTFHCEILESVEEGSPLGIRHPGGTSSGKPCSNRTAVLKINVSFISRFLWSSLDIDKIICMCNDTIKDVKIMKIKYSTR